MSENMIFCLGTGKWESEGEGFQKSYRIFNKQVTKDEYEKILSSLSSINIPQTKWTDEKYMSAEEKKNIKIAKDIGGFLKTYSCEEAWASFWATATSEQKSAILNISQFDAEIFKGITGLDVANVATSSVEQEAIEVLKKAGYSIIKD